MTLRSFPMKFKIAYRRQKKSCKSILLGSVFVVLISSSGYLNSTRCEQHTNTYFLVQIFFFKNSMESKSLDIFFFNSVGRGWGFVCVGSPSMCFNVLWLWLSGSCRHSKSNPWIYRCWQVLPFSNNLPDNSDAWHTDKGAAAESHQVGRIWVLSRGSQSRGINREHGENHLHKFAFWRKRHFLNKEKVSVSVPPSSPPGTYHSN